MLTKDIIGKLSLEQREVLAKAEFFKSQRRQKLFEQARGRDWRSRYFPLYIFCVCLVFIGMFCFNLFDCQKSPVICYLLIGIVLASVVRFEIARTNRRVDALLELLDLDRMEREDQKMQTDPKVG